MKGSDPVPVVLLDMTTMGALLKTGKGRRLALHVDGHPASFLGVRFGKGSIFLGDVFLRPDQATGRIYQAARTVHHGRARWALRFTDPSAMATFSIVTPAEASVTASELLRKAAYDPSGDNADAEQPRREMNTARWKYRVWCGDCFGEDPMGCFGGGSDESAEDFTTKNDAETAGEKACSNGRPYRFEVFLLPPEAKPGETP